MFRPLTLLLILCLVFATVDAATHVGAWDVGSPAASHEAHEVHTSPDSPAPDGSKAHHFCHCAAHSPAFASTGAAAVPFESSMTNIPPEPLLGASNLPPPLRPPNAA